MPERRFYVLESLLDLIQENFLQIPDFFQTFQTFQDFYLIPDISGRRGNPDVVSAKFNPFFTRGFSLFKNKIKCVESTF